LEQPDIDIINDILGQITWLTVKEPAAMRSEKGRSQVTSAIAIPVPGYPSNLEVFIWFDENFPLGEMRFIGKNFNGYPHQMPIGWICLNSELSADLGPRLEFELDKLRTWIDRYYIAGEKDEQYEYPTTKRDQVPLVLVFDEDPVSYRRVEVAGWFEYRGLRNIDRNGRQADTWIITKIGNQKARWSETFLGSLDFKQDGLYVFLNDPPLGRGRELVDTWNELLPLLTETQRKFIHDNRFIVRRNPRMGGGFVLLIGYPISQDATREIHWLTIFMPYAEFPYAAAKVGVGSWTSRDLGKEIIWGSTENASYDRLFGRGRLSDKITGKRVLILGTGAVGSTLYISLVRGGCRFIDIQDPDVVTPGNVVRGQFRIKESYAPKVDELVSEAVSISPFLEVTGNSKRFAPLRPATPAFKETRKTLNGYDHIFDCTTDKLLSVSLDKMQLRPPVFNLSLTNGATHMAWITGFGNIHRVKSAFYERLEEPETKTMFLAQGCWHPTFKATNADVQILVNLGLKEFLRMLDADGAASSFYVQQTGGDKEPLGYQIKKDV
jgi:hypothetical protein